MFGIHDFGLFVLAGLLLNITPGADLLYITARAGSGGFGAGFKASLGVGAGCLVHISLAVLGLSALLYQWAHLFMVVKLIGAVYLLYLGVSMLLSQAKPTQKTHLKSEAIFWQGFLTNALNPKVALFFLAFLPQFVAPNSPEAPLAFLVLGLVFSVNGLVVSAGVALVASKAAVRLGQNPWIGLWLKRMAGSLFVYFGVRLALSER
ncbi:MAG: LysE family translocator [Campylobacterales bacterium]|nr:LysE family translocator [Campylobacterales bacterium]